jgi:hypothetical protein
MGLAKCCHRLKIFSVESRYLGDVKMFFGSGSAAIRAAMLRVIIKSSARFVIDFHLFRHGNRDRMI